jgi:hypothetical protein
LFDGIGGGEKAEIQPLYSSLKKTSPQNYQYRSNRSMDRYHHQFPVFSGNPVSFLSIYVGLPVVHGS